MTQPVLQEPFDIHPNNLIHDVWAANVRGAYKVGESFYEAWTSDYLTACRFWGDVFRASVGLAPQHEEEIRRKYRAPRFVMPTRKGA